MIVNAIPRANISESIRCRIYYGLSLLLSLSAGLMDGLAPAGMDEGAFIRGLCSRDRGPPGRCSHDSSLSAGPSPTFSNLYPSLAFPMPPPSPMTFIADRHLFMQINSTTDLLIVLSFSDK